VILDWIDFGDDEVGQRHQERGSQIGPQRVAVKVGPLQGIPRCDQFVPGERVARVDSFTYYTAVKLFDGNALRREIGFLVGRAKRLHRCPFVLQRNGHPSWCGILRLALDLPQLAAADDRRLDGAESAPPVEPSVGCEHRIEQTSHYRSPPIG
jgi:hypothetical protein